jgi:hypothetical protein
MDSANPIGEIVESSTTFFVAQCLEMPRGTQPRLYDPPPFGSFVKVGKQIPHPDPLLGKEREVTVAEERDPFATPPTTPADTIELPPAVYALVIGANTASIEANRRPAALGYEDEDEILRQQPQIFELLRTDFSGLLIAYSVAGEKGVRRHLPPVPPRIHARVYPCTVTEVRALSLDLGFLRGILTPSGALPPGVPGDELAAACLREARRAQVDDYPFLVRAGKTLAGILAEDYERLQAILRNLL